MTASRVPPPAWLGRAFQEVQRRRHLVLHGNVDDLVLWEDGSYRPTAEAVAHFLAAMGFSGVAGYDLAGGLTRSEGGNEALVLRLMAVPSPDGAPAAAGVPSGSGAPSGSGPTSPGTPDGVPGEVAAAPLPGHGAPGGTYPERTAGMSAAGQRLQERLRTARAAGPRTVDDLLPAAHRLLTQTEAACALVINSADLLFGSALPSGEEIRLHMSYLRRILVEATTAPGALEPLRNTVVLIAKDLSALPSWVHLGNPHVAVIALEPPSLPERTFFLRGKLPEFHGYEALSSGEVDRACATLANITDGMTMVDMASLVATSRVTGTGIDVPRRLVARHRFGLRASPWEQLGRDRIASAMSALSARVMGQDPAVRAVVDVLVNARVGLDFATDGEASSGPRGVFFFVGPTGVGKTEMAKAIADLVFEDEAALARFDMSEFSQEHASERLTGAPPGFVGHEQGGALTNRVLERPFSVVLFDEIEKAHPKIFDKFLQILDDGRLTDGQGRTAYFSQTVVIFTSNIGAEDLRASMLASNQPPAYRLVEEHFRRSVQNLLTTGLRRPEMLGRLGNGIVVFDVLREPVISGIVGKFLDKLAASAAARSLDIVFDRTSIARAVTEEVIRDGAALGARQIRSPLLEQWVRIPLNRWVFENEPEPGARVWVHAGPGSPPFVVERLPEGVTA